MEQGLNNEVEVVDGLVEIVDVGFENRTSMVKGIVLGAVGVGAAWLGVKLYKKFKNRKTIEIEPGKVEESK